MGSLRSGVKSGASGARPETGVGFGPTSVPGSNSGPSRSLGPSLADIGAGGTICCPNPSLGRISVAEHNQKAIARRLKKVIEAS